MRYQTEWTEAEVVSTELVSSSVRQLEFMPVTGTEIFTPGSHLSFEVMINNLPETRSYSLVGLYEKNKPYRVSVKQLAESRGGSNYMWQLKPGAKIKISRPANNFELQFKHADYLLVAGGIGITPMVGMAQVLASKKVNVTMVYVGNSESDMPYINELTALLGDKLTVHTLEKDKTFFNFKKLISELTPGTQMYLCGPLGMMDEVRHQWEAHKLPATDLRFETFGASGKFAPQAFKISIPRLKLELKVEKNQSMLDVLNKAGADIIYDCVKGECGLCMVDILSCSGEVDHRDFFLSDEQKKENKKMCTCVSRVANGDIVIDTAFRGTEKTVENIAAKTNN